MTLVPYTLTLSRWHHVAERIRSLADAKHKRALQALGMTTISQSLTQEQIEALGQRGEQALALIKQAVGDLGYVGTIRKELAQANADRGISALLAEADSKRRQARLLAHYTEIDMVTRTPLENVNAALENRSSKGSDFFSHRNEGVDVALVKGDALDFAQTQRTSLEAQVASLMDEVTETNRTTLTVELPQQLAEDVGL